MKWFTQFVCGVAAGSWVSSALGGEPSQFTYIMTFFAFAALSFSIALSDTRPV
jgi:hypothetical protein